MCLFSNRSQMTSKYGKKKKVVHEAQPSVSLMFLPHFDVLCDLLLNRRTTTWNLFVLYNKELKYTKKKPFYFKFRHFDSHENSTQRNVFFFSSSCLSQLSTASARIFSKSSFSQSAKFSKLSAIFKKQRAKVHVHFFF